MTKTVTITGYVYEVDYGWGGSPEYRFFAMDTMADQHYTLIGPVEFTYEVPETFNATAAKIATLEAKEQQLREEFNARVREIRERVSKLQALEYVEVA